MSSPADLGASARALDAATLRGWPLPDPGRTKQSRGDAVIVGASRRTPGAVILAFESAMRVGAGRVGLVVPGSVEEQLGTHVPEAAVFSLPDDPDAPLEGSAADAVAQADAVLVGPGFDDVSQTRSTLDAVLDLHPRRLVLDAYALAVVADIDRGRLPADVVLTPNEGELGMLLDVDLTDADDLADAAVQAAQRFDVTIATYGLVATPDGELLRRDGGGPGLATAGSGDVLAGAITGFLARAETPQQAAAWGIWSHLRAGERLTETHGLGFLARELATELAFAVREIGEGGQD